LHARDDASQDSLTAAIADASSASSTWKLLIYDRYCQDILSPLLTVAELRSLGITLHMSLLAPRERVPDIPAVYFVRPTEENLRIIASDVQKGIYDSTHINFSTSVPSVLLESFASMLLQTPTAAPGRALTSGAAAASRIVRIMDQYAEFISLEDRLFTLNATDSFARLNGGGDDQAMLAHVEEIVTSLFSVCVTTGVVPIIRAKVGHAAQMVAQKLDARLREHLSSRNNLFSGGAAGAALGFHRPLLLLTDRNLDLSAPLLHSWTYQALLHDLLGMTSNRVTVQVADAATPNGPPPKLKPKTYDLLSGEDKFWKHHSGKPFPKVAEGVTERLAAYQAEFNAVTKKAGAAGAAGAAAGGDELASAINALPKLQRRKKLLDTHMNIATALLKEIKSREIDVFFDLEKSILEKQSIDKAAIASIYGGPAAPADAQAGKGLLSDRLRFLLIHYLQNGINDDQLAQYRQLLEASLMTPAASADGQPTPAASSSTIEAQRDLAAIDYVKQFKFLHRMSAGEDIGGSQAVQKQAAPAGGMLGGFSKLADSLYGSALAGVRNLLPSNNHLPITRLVEQLMVNRDGAESLDAQYQYFDPKSTSRRVAKLTGNYKECIVFVLGGGTYNEYQNLQDWSVSFFCYCRRMIPCAPGSRLALVIVLFSRQRDPQSSHGVTSVVYGCSELVAPDQFLKQIAHMQAAATGSHVAVD
jgi:hypothetical protein